MRRRPRIRKLRAAWHRAQATLGVILFVLKAYRRRRELAEYLVGVGNLARALGFAGPETPSSSQTAGSSSVSRPPAPPRGAGLSARNIVDAGEWLPDGSWRP